MKNKKVLEIIKPLLRIKNKLTQNLVNLEEEQVSFFSKFTKKEKQIITNLFKGNPKININNQILPISVVIEIFHFIEDEIYLWEKPKSGFKLLGTKVS